MKRGGRLNQWAVRYHRLTLRERIIVAVALCALLLLISYVFFLSPVMKKSAFLRQQVTSVKIQVKTLQDELALMRTPPDVDKVKQKQQLAEDLEKLHQNVQLYEGQTVTADNILVEVRRLLEKEPGLTFTNIRQSSGKSMVVSAPDQTQARYIESTYILTFSGEYHATLAYLQALESLPWRIFWDQLSYRVTQYPRARISLQFSTLAKGDA